MTGMGAGEMSSRRELFRKETDPLSVVQCVAMKRCLRHDMIRFEGLVIPQGNFSSFRLQVAGYRSQAAAYRLQVAG